MPRTENYFYEHEQTTPEPRGVPGYTGYVPGSGPKRIYQMGQTYGHMTHDLMEADKMAGARLAPLHDHTKHLDKTQSDVAKVLDREERLHDDLLLRTDLVSGYVGYVPQKEYKFGKRYQPECIEAIADFENFQRDVRTEKTFVLPDPASLEPEKREAPKVRPYGPNKNVSIPQYNTYPEIKNFEQRLLEMGPRNRQKKHMPGYTGHIPEKNKNFGMSNSDASNAGFKAMSQRLEEHRILGERPCLRDWYVGTVPSESEKCHLKQYRHPLEHMTGPSGSAFENTIFSGYGGYVPLTERDREITYRKAAGKFYREQDVKSSVKDCLMQQR